jgi:tetratricopeptide (TPR) repeat protein
MQPNHTAVQNKAIWFFYLWFLACLIITLFKIPLNLFSDIQNLILTFQNCSWTWNQIVQIECAHLTVLLISAAFVVLLVATGKQILDVFVNDIFSKMERWVWSLALGLAFWGLLAEGLALTHLFYPVLLQALSAFGLLVLVLKDKFRVREYCWPFEKIKGFPWYWKTVLGLLLILTLSNLLAPEMSWDAITYQLVLPRYYLLHHGFYLVPGIAPSQYPSLGEMFFSWGLVWGSDSIARFFCFWVHLSTVLALICLGKRLGSEKAGWYAAAFYGFFPYLNIYSTRGYVDLFAGFYATLGLGVLVCLASEKNTAVQDSKQKGVLFLAMIALAAVWAIKYNAIGYWLAAFIILAWNFRKRSEASFLLMSLFTLPLFFFGPWALKAWIYTHNPIYPYLPDCFGTFNWNEFDQRVSAIKFPVAGLKGIIHLPMILWGIFFNRYSGAPNEEVGIAILVFSPLLFIKGIGKKLGIWALAAGVPFFFWLITSHQLRLITPVLALASLLVGLGFDNALTVWKEKAKWIIWMPLILSCLAVIYLFQGLLEQPNPFPNFLGFQTPDQFLSQIMRPIGYVDLNNELNHKLPAESKVLILGQQNGYYLQRESVFDFDYIHPLLKTWVDKSSSPAEIYQWFLKNDFKYLLYNSNGMMGGVVRADELGVTRYDWSPQQLKNYEQFFLKYTQKVPLVTAGYALYKIGPREGFSTFPEFLPGTEKYYLDDMVQLMGYKRVSSIVGKSLPPEIYARAYAAVAEQHPEMGYACFQSAMADLAEKRTKDGDVLKKGKMGFERSGDEASWLVLRADLLLSKAKSKEAVSYLEKAQLLSPERDDVARNLAVAYYNEHHLDQAVKEAEVALSLAPGSDDYRKLLSQLQSLPVKR